MKKLKRIFSLFLVLTFATLGVVISATEVKADTSNRLTYNGQTINLIDGQGLEFEFDDDGIDHILTISSAGPGIYEYMTIDAKQMYHTVSVFGNAILTYNGQTINLIDGQGLEFEFDDDGIDHILTISSAGPGIYEYMTIDAKQIYHTVSVRVGPDNTRPAISGQENFVTNVDDAKPLSFFQAYITAVDETDGVVPVYVITDNYTTNKSVLGTHKVVFGAKDNSDNEATLEVYIRVVDITNPIITGNSSVAKIGYKETWSISNFKTTLTVSDNYDTLTHNDITVKSDGYTTNKTKLGTYNVVYAVLDNSGNEGTFTKQIQVYDNVKPNISGPSTIATSNTTLLTEADIRAQLTASDEIDGNITSKIELVEDNYTGQGNKVGSYTIKYRVIDNAGNVGEHTVTIQRSDKIPPVFFIEDGVTIKTTPTTPLNLNQIIQILEATGQVTVNSATTFSTIWEDYTGNEDEPGIYTWAVKARSTDGNASDHYMSIMVLDTEDEDGVEVNPDLSALEWIKENPVLFAVSLFAVIAVVGIIFRKKRK